MSEDESNPESNEEEDSSDDSDNCEDDGEVSRQKRSAPIAWCDVDSEVDNAMATTSSMNHDGDWMSSGDNPHSNPKFGNKMQLYCKTSYMLAIYSENDVRGSYEDDDQYTYLELSSADNIPGHVRIKCLANELYLGMKKSGRLYGEPDGSKETTVFIESLAGSYNNYLSRKWAHLGYYVGLRRSGKVKKGPKTAYGQKAIQFLPRRSNTS